MKNLEESRPRLHEELAQREKSLRDTRNSNIQEVEYLKRAQEMRINEFSRHEMRESHATVQELTSQIPELQERMNYMNDSGEFQVVESTCSGKTIPRFQSTRNPSKSWWTAEPRPKFACDLIHLICSVQRETFLTVHVQYSIFHRLLIKECFTLGIKVLPETQCEIVQGNLSLEVMKEIERLFQL